MRKMHILPLLALTVSVAGMAVAPNLLAQEKQLPASSTSVIGFPLQGKAFALHVGQLDWLQTTTTLRELVWCE